MDHITLVVVDLEATRKFYVDIIGMGEVERPDFGFPGLWFQLGDTQIHLNVAGERAGKPGLPDMGASSPSQGFHFAFSVADAEKAAAQFTDLGFEIIDGPRPRPDGAVQFYVRDPDGHLVEICDAPRPS